MKFLVPMQLLIVALFAQSIQMPQKSYHASGAVVDMVVEGQRLYAATNVGIVDIFDIKSAKKVQTIRVPRIRDFMGDLVDSKIYSVDLIDQRLAILSQASGGFGRLHIFHNGELQEVIGEKAKLNIAKANFLDSHTLIVATLGSEIIQYDLKNKKQRWLKQVSHSKFSNFALNEKKDEIVIADESGDLKLLRTADGSLIRVLSGQNVDNVFQVDYKNGVIATAGQDRRIVIYDMKNGVTYYKSSPFLIYSAALSPTAAIAAYSSDENNNITLFETQTKKDIDLYGANKMTITKILFLNEKEFLVSSDDTRINYYTIGGR